MNIQALILLVGLMTADAASQNCRSVMPGFPWLGRTCDNRGSGSRLDNDREDTPSANNGDTSNDSPGNSGSPGKGKGKGGGHGHGKGGSKK